MKSKKIVLLFVFFFICFLTLNFRVKSNSLEMDIDSQLLYSETNTFDYNELVADNGQEIDTLNYDFENDYRYDMTVKNGNVVSGNQPFITVLTHGLGVSGSIGGDSGEDGESY